MSLFKRRKIRIPDGKYRIVKLGKDALYEILHSYFKDNQEGIFDVTDCTTIVTCFDINWDTGEVIFIARGDYGENERLQFDIDTDELFSKLQNTTESMYNGEKRYVEMSEEEIKNL